MNYKNIGSQLLEANYVDSRMLFCHSHRSYTTANNYFAVMEFKTLGNNFFLPYFMLLSIKDDYLHISYTHSNGNYLKHYASFKLSNLRFIDYNKVDKLVDIYRYEIIDAQEVFSIIVTHEKKAASALTDAINTSN